MTTTKHKMPPLDRDAAIREAWAIACGNAPADAAVTCHKIRGDWNDFGYCGGYARMRRVWRDGTWQWISRPASRGRSTMRQRYDTRYGDVRTGEIIAQYTASYSTSGMNIPDYWFLVTGHALIDSVLVRLSATRRSDGQWQLSLLGIKDVCAGADSTLVVPDPYWRERDGTVRR